MLQGLPAKLIGAYKALVRVHRHVEYARLSNRNGNFGRLYSLINRDMLSLITPTSKLEPYKGARA